MNTAPKAIYSLGSVDVNAIDPYTKRIGFNVHITCLPHETNTDKVKQDAIVIVAKKLRYLTSEGLVDHTNQWNVSIDIVGHPPQYK